MSFLGLFNYPPGSARALLAGTLHLRYCAARFAWRAPLGGCLYLDMLLVWLLLILGVAEGNGVEWTTRGSLGYFFWTRTEKFD